MNKTRFLVLAGLILAAAMSRLAPHPANFAPIAAMALFGGACFRDKSWGFAVPLTAMILSDLAIDLHWINLPWRTYPTDNALLWGKVFVYGAFALSVCLGFWLKNRRTLVPIAVATLAGSLVFFLLTNFGAWVFDPQYAKTFSGLMQCYEAGLPFWRHSLSGDAFYAAVLFGGLALAERWVPALQETALLETP